VVAALEEATGWDARRAEVIVGTSAGSLVAASLRAGLGPSDHHARATDGPLSEGGAGLLADLPDQDDASLYPVRSQGLPLPASLGLLVPAFVRRGTPRPGLAAAGLLPRGGQRTDMIGQGVDALSEHRWPDAPTWICAVDLGRGRRVVFGRDDVHVSSIGRAVEASCAIPGFFRPVRIGESEYVDGGTYSATNADLVAGLGFDLVVVSSPMSASRGAIQRSIAAVWRGTHALRLKGEVDAIRDRGSRVVVIQPTRDDLAVMGHNPMDRSRRGAVADQARRSARARLDRVDELTLACLQPSSSRTA
jgi:NTE family protein